MLIEDNKCISRRFLEELWNKKDMSIVDELIADTYIDHTPPPSASDEEVQGPAAVKDLFTQVLLSDFSDIQISIEDQIAEEDRVMTRATWTFTLIPDDPSKDPQVVTIVGIGVDRIDGGKIVENWNTLDVMYSLITQLELPDPLPPVPVPPPPTCNSCRDGFVCKPGFGCVHV